MMFATFAMLFVLFLISLHATHRLCLYFHYGVAGFCWLSVVGASVAWVMLRYLAGEQMYSVTRDYWPVSFGVAILAVWFYDWVQTWYFNHT